MKPKLKRIHVNQAKIKANRKNGTNDPVITVKCGKKNTYGHEVEIQGPSKVVYRPNNPLSCGARLWIETHDRVLVDGNEVEVSVETACKTLNDALQAIGQDRFVRQHFSGNWYSWLWGMYFYYSQYDSVQHFEQTLISAGCTRNANGILEWMGFTIKPEYFDAHCCGY